MKKAVVFGLGGIGAYIGTRLQTGGADVECTFIARGAHLKAIQAKGLTLQNPDGTESLVRPVLATDDPREAGIPNYLFLCVKGYDLDVSCEAIKSLVGENTIVLPLLNGADIYERVRSVISQGIVSPAGIYISSTLTKPGYVSHSGGKGNIFLGREPGKSDFNPKDLLALLEQSSIPYEWFEDPFPAIWTKYLFIASYGLVTGMSGKSLGEVLDDPSLAESVVGIAKEIAALARIKGITLPEDAADAAFEKGRLFPPATRTSFQRDIEAKRAFEGDLFGGTILRMGRELGVATPVTSEIYNRILSSKAGN